MTDRVLEIRDASVSLSVRDGLLVIREKKTDRRTQVPLNEIGVLLLANRAGSMTFPVLAELAECIVPTIPRTVPDQGFSTNPSRNNIARMPWGLYLTRVLFADLTGGDDG